MPDLSQSLTHRAHLPDALRVLTDQFPRADWKDHPNFGEMVQFWLDRHAMFRQLTDRLAAETRHYLEHGTDPDDYARLLSRLGGFFLSQLHGHHQIEDMHYFPRLAGLEPRLYHGFELLEADHKEIDALLAGFAEAANAVLRAAQTAEPRDAAGAFHDRLADFAPLLERHLTDEEDLIVPVILKSGFAG